MTVDRGASFKTPENLARDPWPLGWEWLPAVDLCRHQWEVHTTPNGSHGRPEQVSRCSICHTPRCGYSTQPNQCVERRHHDGLHIYPDGSFAPVGGHMPDDDGEGVIPDG